jgi:hypothetical protein
MRDKVDIWDHGADSRICHRISIARNACDAPLFWLIFKVNGMDSGSALRLSGNYGRLVANFTFGD